MLYIEGREQVKDRGFWGTKKLGFTCEDILCIFIYLPVFEDVVQVHWIFRIVALGKTVKRLKKFIRLNEISKGNCKH